MYASRSWIPGNNQGVMETLRVMSSLVREPSPLVVATAQAIAGRASLDAFPSRVRTWILAHVRQELDPYNVELIRSPDWSLSIIQERGAVGGDCDDVATLAAGLGVAVGLDVRFVLLAWGENYSHVYAEIQAPGPPPIWYDMDVHRPPTEGLPLPTRELVVYPST